MTNLSFSYQNPLRTLMGDDFFKGLPTHSGVYFFLDAKKRPLYIGKADQLKRRLQSYANAKPGHAPEHILEMLEHVAELRWEKQATGEKAILRERELIHAVRPPYNIAGTDPAPYLYLGTRTSERQPENRGLAQIDFRLSHFEIGDDFTIFGCFPHRGKTKAGYSALLRLLFASTCLRERFHIPAKLCRTSPVYVHRADIPLKWVKPLERFLKGEDAELLALIFKRLMEQENLSPILYGPLQRDLTTLKEFYAVGPELIAKMKKQARMRGPTLTQERMQELVRRKFVKTFELETLDVS